LGDRLSSLPEKGADFEIEFLTEIVDSLKVLEDGITVLMAIEQMDTPGENEKDAGHFLPGAVLIVGGDPEKSRLLAEDLEGRKMLPVVAGETAEAMKILEHCPPDLILAHVKGLEFLGNLRENKTLNQMPAVIINYTAASYGLEAVELGAEEIITKDFNANEIGSLIEARLKRILERRHAFVRDPISGSFSFEYFMERLAEEIERFSRKKRIFSVAVCRLDLFDRLTGDYGHLVGRFVLREFASFLSQKFRRSDILGWYGAEKFIVLLPETDSRTACKVLERFGEAWEHKALADPFQQADIKVTFSAGVSQFDRDGKTHIDIINSAKNALLNNGENKTKYLVDAVELRTGPRQSQYRILVVDDSLVVRTRIYEELKEKFQVFMAVDGNDALLQISRADPHMVIADLVMPNMGGLELIKNIKQNPRYNDIKIIALTGDRQKKTFLEVVKAGVDDYIVKDFNWQELEPRILRLLKRKSPKI